MQFDGIQLAQYYLDPPFISREHTDAVTCLVIAHSDQFVVTGSKDKHFKMICLNSGEVLHSMKEHEATVTCAVINKADSILVTGITLPLLPPFIHLPLCFHC